MNFYRKNPKADLRTYYPVFLESGIIIVLLIFIAAVKLDLPSEKNNTNLTAEQEVVQMEDIIQTQQEETPPPPPRPQIPVEVPNDEIVEETEINLNSDMNLDDPLALPPPPEEEEEENFFLTVEEMPELKGGLASIQRCVNYPERAQKAGIEGRVIVQFIVNEEGKVEGNNTKVVRGIGGGADEEAVRCVKKAEFKPGLQRGQTVRVQFSLPVVYNLTN